MSSLDSSLFALSSQLGKYGFWIGSKENIYEKNDPTVVKNTRISMIVVAILAVVTSLYFSNFLVHVLQLVSLLTVISVVVLISIILKVSAKETLLGTLIGSASFIYAAFSGLISEVPYTTLYPSIAVIVFMLGQNLVVRAYKSSRKAIS